ncbi:NEDD4-binding protein 2-like 2 [Cheilinus undulatus]|uniref:NEDD4-binding protein 2-like 2 n=1 Tax=Cheilinus undulatus TaxID=241271 RepID=UPI001BD45299|nr:NEDD4-binding protein 2-like 2 [Cheilinus undulatus]
MSHTEPSCTTLDDEENRCEPVGERNEDMKKDSAEEECVIVGTVSSSPDKSKRDRIIKEVGIKSTTFIDPAFPPEKNTNCKKDSTEEDCVILGAVLSRPDRSKRKRVFKEVRSKGATVFDSAFPPEKCKENVKENATEEDCVFVGSVSSSLAKRARERELKEVRVKGTTLDGRVPPERYTEDMTDDSDEEDCVILGAVSSSPDKGERERVLKEVGFTSTAFIGPAFPPVKNTVKPDIEDTLSDFYKELAQIDTPDGASNNQGKQDTCLTQQTTPSNLPQSKDTQVVKEEQTVTPGKTVSIQSSGVQKQLSWQHWYENQPYYPRTPRPDLDHSISRSAPPQNHWHHPQTTNRPPNPRFHTPPFYPPPFPPPPFPNPQNPPPHVNPNFGGFTNQHQEDPNFIPLSNSPSPDVCSQPSQGFYRDSPQHFDRDERFCGYDGHSDNVNSEWSTDREEEGSQFGEDYGRGQRNGPENEPYDRYFQHPENTNAHHSSLVLILMRGLPGSGKSTLARELLSTGPSGLILSTDDYFAHGDGYRYEVGLLGEAHDWNQRRAKDAMLDGRSPIIIDNTNIQAWEMKPYVKMAMERGYRVDFCEPDTSWKFDPCELEKRNKHGVNQEKIAQMMDRFSSPVSIDIVMSSQEPQHVNQRRKPNQPWNRRNNRHFR